jgi:hypothetical protein
MVRGLVQHHTVQPNDVTIVVCQFSMVAIVRPNDVRLEVSMNG